MLLTVCPSLCASRRLRNLIHNPEYIHTRSTPADEQFERVRTLHGRTAEQEQKFLRTAQGLFDLFDISAERYDLTLSAVAEGLQHIDTSLSAHAARQLASMCDADSNGKISVEELSQKLGYKRPVILALYILCLNCCPHDCLFVTVPCA